MSKLNEDIIISIWKTDARRRIFVLINEWMKESDENAGELFRMEEIYQLGKFPFEEENLVAKAERRWVEDWNRKIKRDRRCSSLRVCCVMQLL